jgi:hypothetical protein
MTDSQPTGNFAGLFRTVCRYGKRSHPGRPGAFGRSRPRLPKLCCPNYFDRQFRVTTDLCIASATVASKPSGPAPPHAPHAARLCEPRINSPPGLVLCEWWIANKKPRRSGASSIRENRAAVLPAPRQYRGHTEESLRWPYFKKPHRRYPDTRQPRVRA